MIWPLPVNVRFSPLRIGQLMDVVAQCANEQQEIADFPEYGTNLSPGQMIRLRAIAAEIIRSFETQSPVAAIAIIGHADVALKVPVGERAKKEQQVSEDRAKNAEKQLMDLIKSMPGGASPAAMVTTKATGVGSKEPVVPNAFTEEQMKKNRRVVFKWSRCLLPGPIIHPPLDFPPRPNVDPNDDPNVVFAGQHFRIRILDGFSAGEVGGVFSYHFEIWDTDNNRSAEYSYGGLIGTVGVPPFTECGESSWSNPFSTKNFVQVNQFSGEASHMSGSIGVASGMRFTFEAFTDAKVSMDPGDATINIIAGPSKSLGAEASAVNGNFQVIRGSVKVFKGP